VRSLKGNSGFTLIEIVIVITILGILMGLATPIVNKTVERHSVTAFEENLPEI